MAQISALYAIVSLSKKRIAKVSNEVKSFFLWYLWDFVMSASPVEGEGWGDSASVLF